jgi:hypothetical protein
MNIIVQIGFYLQQHIPSISIGLTATFLMVIGPRLNRIFRKQTSGTNTLVRFVLFVLFCTFGYGLLSSQMVKWVISLLNPLSSVQLLFTVIISFVLLAFFSKKNGEI